MKVSKMVVVPAVLATAFAAYGFVKTATPFADNMVLQRGRAVPVWGVADPGEKVTVAFAGQTKTAQAGADGKWSVSLDAMDASKENRVLTVAGASNTETIKNVLVGEVWFASGQSNTECPIWGPSPRYRDGQGAVPHLGTQPALPRRAGRRDDRGGATSVHPLREERADAIPHAEAGLEGRLARLFAPVIQGDLQGQPLRNGVLLRP